MNPDEIGDAVAKAFHDEWGRVVATLIGFTGDWDLAEECAQDAFALALERWKRDGVPRNPGAWLTTAAKNRAIDKVRRAATGAAKLREVAVMGHAAQSGDSPADPSDGATDAAESGIDVCARSRAEARADRSAPGASPPRRLSAPARFRDCCPCASGCVSSAWRGGWRCLWADSVEDRRVALVVDAVGVGVVAREKAE